MPSYEYRCEDCKKNFMVVLSLKEADQKPKCPDCKSNNVVKAYSGFTAMTSKKS